MPNTPSSVSERGSPYNRRRKPAVATTTTRLMTVAEFQRLPEPGAYYHELRHGEVVKVTRPKLNHVIAQKRLLSLLDALDAGAAFTEFGFRPRPEYELRV